MLKTISERRRVECEEFRLSFCHKKTGFGSYGFACDKDGKLLPFLLDGKPNTCALLNYLRCEVSYASQGIEPRLS